jgi:cell division protein FtsL
MTTRNQETVEKPEDIEVVCQRRKRKITVWDVLISIISFIFLLFLIMTISRTMACIEFRNHIEKALAHEDARIQQQQNQQKNPYYPSESATQRAEVVPPPSSAPVYVDGEEDKREENPEYITRGKLGTLKMSPRWSRPTSSSESVL